MERSQIFMGAAVALLSLAALFKTRQVMELSHLGRRLSRNVGESRAVQILRVVFVIGLTFGVSLACGLIQPLRWN